MRFFIFFFLLVFEVSAQDLKFIPDSNLRKELKSQGFVTNDSLDLGKTYGIQVLELQNKKIENLDGLQYFEEVTILSIQYNNIKKLENLPPKVTYLKCFNNYISSIDKLPVHLKYLDCSNNEIKEIKNLPSSLVSLNFRGNLLREFPEIPKSIQFINYSNNPIPFTSLPKIYQSVPCEDSFQNCLPHALMKWNILNASEIDTSLHITGMRVKLTTNYYGILGKKEETISFKSKKSEMVAKKWQVHTTKNNQHTNYYRRDKYSVDDKRVKEIIKDIFLEKISIQIENEDGIKSVDLNDKKNGKNCALTCSHCTGYKIEYFIFSKTDTINLAYHFSSAISNGGSFCSASGTKDLKSYIDWFYIFKLTNLTIPNHELIKRYFNESNLLLSIDRVND